MNRTEHDETPIDLGKILSGSPGSLLGPRDIVFIPDSAAKATFSRGLEAATQHSQASWFSTGSMTEQDKLELYNRSRSNGGGAGALEGRLVEFADSYEILEPHEAPNFRAYARILRKRLQAVLIVFFILFSVVLIARSTEACVPGSGVVRDSKENPDIPTIQEL